MKVMLTREFESNMPFPIFRYFKSEIRKQFFFKFGEKLKEINYKSMCHHAHQKLFTRENINQDIWNDFFCKIAVNQSFDKSSGIFLVTHVAPECKLGTLPKPHKDT